MNDDTLIGEARAGNPAVANEFCRRVFPVVARTVRRLLGRDHEDLEDLGQIAVIELVGAIGRFRAESSLDTWVSAVTARVVYKHLRQHPQERSFPLDLLPDAAVRSRRLDGEGTAAARQILTRILGHLGAIGEKLTSTYVMHDVLGHALRDVARIAGISEAAAQSRLVRCRRQLHQRISNDPELASFFDEIGALRTP